MFEVPFEYAHIPLEKTGGLTIELFQHLQSPKPIDSYRQNQIKFIAIPQSIYEITHLCKVSIFLVYERNN